jgi:Tfp pilus assembly protein PilV
MNDMLFKDFGFTILEMLISVILLVVGTVSILNMFGVAMTADTQIENSSIGLFLAQEEMELIKDADSWAEIDSFATPRTSIGGDFSTFDKEVIVTGDPKKVNVIIYWNTRGIDQSVELATLFTDYHYQ